MIRSLVLSVLLLLAVPAFCQITFTREEFDRLEARGTAHRNISQADADDFAWNEGYYMRGYVEMYLATGDREYLRKLVKVADQIIETRDDKRAAREGRKDRALWSLGGKYTVARLTLKDAQGRDVIGLRSIRYAYNDQTMVTVQPGTQPGTFSLLSSSDFWKDYFKAGFEFHDLSLDPASPRYFERIINDPQYIPDPNFKRDPDSPASPLFVATDLRRDKRPTDVPAAVDKSLLVPSVIQYYGYTGPIFAPMTRFAKLVLDRPELQAEFKPAAARYIQAAAESVAAWDVCWRNGPGPNEGAWMLVEKGADFWCDGIMAPWNYMGACGQVICNLWDWTKDPKYLDRLTRLATCFKNDCTRLKNSSYSFPYWSRVTCTGWTKAQRLSVNTPEYPPYPKPDDVSHASLEVEFAIMCAERGIVFTRTDMQRFARTFTRNIWQPETKTLAQMVDGKGTADEGTAIAGARWIDLAAYDPQVFEINRTIWSGLRLGTYGHVVGNYARMYRWQEALRAKDSK